MPGQSRDDNFQGTNCKIGFSSVKSNRSQAFLATVMSLGHITIILYIYIYQHH